MGATSDIAAACLFLTSDLSGYISGRTIVVDGGHQRITHAEVGLGTAGVDEGGDDGLQRGKRGRAVEIDP